jgi:hypothetical protein
VIPRACSHTSGKHQIEWSALPRDVRVIRGDQHRIDSGAGSACPRRSSSTFDRQSPAAGAPQHDQMSPIRRSEFPDERLVIVGGHIDLRDGAEVRSRPAARRRSRRRATCRRWREAEAHRFASAVVGRRTGLVGLRPTSQRIPSSFINIKSVVLVR